MKKKIAIGVLSAALLVSAKFLDDYRTMRLDTRHFIVQNFSDEWRLMHSQIGDIQCLMTKHVKDYDKKEFLNHFGRIRSDIYTISNSIADYEDLNEAYSVDPYIIVDILDTIENDIIEEGSPSDLHRKTIEEMVAINEQYSIIGSASLYNVRMSQFKNLPLPEEVTKYIDAMQNVRNKMLTGLL